MNTAILTSVFILAGLGVAQNLEQSVGSPSTITFFQNSSVATEKMTLSPDPLVTKELPNIAPPTTTVVVYLPLYTGATLAKTVPTIGDLGTPLDADLVDGTLYLAEFLMIVA